MPQTVYVETSVASAHASARDDPASVFRRDVTRQWWSQQSHLYELRSSLAVLTELGAGKYPGQQEATDLVRSLPLLDISDEALAIAEAYVRHRVMPEPAAGDAVHLAVASLHEVDYLLTWNIRHLANPNKIEHITVINRRLGLVTPVIVSPEGLWTEETV